VAVIIWNKDMEDNHFCYEQWEDIRDRLLAQKRYFTMMLRSDILGSGMSNNWNIARANMEREIAMTEYDIMKILDEIDGELIQAECGMAATEHTRPRNIHNS
jgi:hypothetical protein